MRSAILLTSTYTILFLSDRLVARPVAQTLFKEQAHTLLVEDEAATTDAPHRLSRRSPVEGDPANSGGARVPSLQALASRVVGENKLGVDHATTVRNGMSEDWDIISQLERDHTGNFVRDHEGKVLPEPTLLNPDGTPLANPDRTPWTKPSDTHVPPKSRMMERAISDWLEDENSPRVIWMLQNMMYRAEERYPRHLWYPKTPYYLQRAWRGLMGPAGERGGPAFGPAEKSTILKTVLGWDLTPEQLRFLLRRNPYDATTGVIMVNGQSWLNEEGDKIYVTPAQRMQAVIPNALEGSMEHTYQNLLRDRFPMTLQQTCTLNELIVDLTNPPRSFNKEDMIQVVNSFTFAPPTFPTKTPDLRSDFESAGPHRDIKKDFMRLHWSQQVSLWEMAHVAKQRWEGFKTTGMHMDRVYPSR